MKQTSSLTRKLTAAQETEWASKQPYATKIDTSAVVYRIYTEFFPNLLELTARYFEGATLVYANGLYDGKTEQGGVLDIVGTKADLQNIVHLAGDIKHVNGQSSVLVTYAGVMAVTI